LLESLFSADFNESKDWSINEVNKAARIAFRWATFPTEQTFDAGGDYNWGMISIGLTPGDKFDLKVNWTEDKQQNNQGLKNLKRPTNSNNLYFTLF